MINDTYFDNILMSLNLDFDSKGALLYNKFNEILPSISIIDNQFRGSKAGFGSLIYHDFNEI